MSTLDFSVHAARVDAASLRRIIEVLRPITVEVAQRDLIRHQDDRTEEIDVGRRAAAIKLAKGALAAQGEVSMVIKKLKERSGVVHDQLGWGDPMPLEKIEDCASAELVAASYNGGYWGVLNLKVSDWGCEVSIDAGPEEIERVGAAVKDVLTAAVDSSQLAATQRPFKVFIGHGSDSQWKYLYEMFSKVHGFNVEAFESSERAGIHTLFVVDKMIRSSSVALVVMTGEDQMADGSMRARENVVHEIGYCQGALGIDRTIILLEDGISEPSNIAGLTQIRFAKNSLIDAQDRILNTLNLHKQAQDFSEI
ncbi:TIR domain-containing protein [Cryobacterium arcticum]|nr:TIR domain-containing protein [Cryobacterium arcticum]